ncbi:MAG: energy transducer TonB [Planctomycetes bacterium]|nr:energy transducer TonB [Planctomycetota bacterium]
MRWTPWVISTLTHGAILIASGLIHLPLRAEARQPPRIILREEQVSVSLTGELAKPVPLTQLGAEPAVILPESAEATISTSASSGRLASAGALSPTRRSGGGGGASSPLVPRGTATGGVGNAWPGLPISAHTPGEIVVPVGAVNGTPRGQPGVAVGGWVSVSVIGPAGKPDGTADAPIAAEAMAGDGSGTGNGTGIGSGTGSGAGNGEGGGEGIDGAGIGVIYLPVPEYPPAALRSGEHGIVLLELEVIEDGSVGVVKTISGEEFTELVRAAVEAAGRSRFKPVTSLGRPAKTRVRVPYDFQLRPARNP